MGSYYILFNCNDWKTYDSLELVGVFTRDALIGLLKNRINIGSYKFDTDSDINDMDVAEIEKIIKYAYIQKLEINEVMD